MTPYPCPSGTWSTASGLADQTQCVDVGPGYWAPTGSSVAQPCASGFYCPGRQYDTVNQQPGALPLALATGGVTETVTVAVGWEVVGTPLVSTQLLVDLGDGATSEVRMVRSPFSCTHTPHSTHSYPTHVYTHMTLEALRRR